MENKNESIYYWETKGPGMGLQFKKWIPFSQTDYMQQDTHGLTKILSALPFALGQNTRTEMWQMQALFI